MGHVFTFPPPSTVPELSMEPSIALARFGAPGLELNFVSGALDPRITFSRASNATVTGPDGTLQYAPHNLLTYSEQFDNAVWLKSNATVTANAAAAPDGALTADKLVEDTNTGNHVLQSAAVTLAAVPTTFSVFVKENGRGWVAFRIQGVTRAYFNIATGVVGTVDASSTAAIASIGNNWYRCSITLTPSAGAANVFIRLATADGVDSYTGDGTSGIYLWGAQLNVGSLQPYYPTTVKNLLGFTQEFDNAAWTKSNSFVQTNLLTWSEQFDNAAWGKLTSTISPNQAIAPDGTLTADKFVANNGTAGYIEQSVSYIAGNTYVWSFYAKAAERDSVSFLVYGTNFGGTNLGRTYTLTGTGSVSSLSGTSAPTAATIISVGDGWYRCTFTAVCFTSHTGASFQIRDGVNGNGTAGRFIWGAQLVQGSTPGDYQRTEGTARAVMYPAPDGSRTADKLVENTAAGFHNLGAPTTSVVTGCAYTYSVYVKAAERYVFQVNSATGFGTNAVRYNLQTGVYTVLVGAPEASIEPAGNGWYRCSITVYAASTATGIPFVNYLTDGTTSSYTGDGTSGIYIWGAQLSDSASLDPYVYNPGAAPTAAAYYGPRFDYDPVTLAPRGLLIEEQRTNSIRNNTMQGAVAGTPGTLPTNWNLPSGVVAGLTSAVVDIGAEDGIPYLDFRLSGTPSATTIVDLAFDGANVISASNGQSWTQSNYVKLAGGSTTNAPVHLILTGRDSSGAFVANQVTTVVISPTADTLKSQRQAASLTMSSASVAFVQPRVRVTTTAGLPIDITLRIGLPQLELGAFATSVIPTSGAAATRAADVAVMQGANFSNWYRQDEGTLFAESAFLAGVAAQSFTAQIAGDSSNYIAMYRDSSNQRLTGRIRSGAVDQAFMYATASSVIGGAQYKQALAYKVDDFATAANGASALTDTSGTVPTSMTTLGIGGAIYTSSVQLNGHIRRIAYFPRRLSNAELIGLTS